MRQKGRVMLLLLAFVLFQMHPLVMSPVNAQKHMEEKSYSSKMTTAKKTATKKNKRILAIVTQDDESDTKSWRKTLRKNRKLGTLIFNEFESFNVSANDIAKKDLKNSFGSNELKNLPALYAIDSKGKFLSSLPFSSFTGEDGSKKLDEFLNKVKVPMPDARKVLSDALAQAKREKKRVFVHLGAPW